MAIVYQQNMGSRGLDELIEEQPVLSEQQWLQEIRNLDLTSESEQLLRQGQQPSISTNNPLLIFLRKEKKRVMQESRQMHLRSYYQDIVYRRQHSWIKVLFSWMILNACMLLFYGSSSSNVNGSAKNICWRSIMTGFTFYALIIFVLVIFSVCYVRRRFEIMVRLVDQYRNAVNSHEEFRQDNGLKYAMELKLRQQTFLLDNAELIFYFSLAMMALFI